MPPSEQGITRDTVFEALLKESARNQFDKRGVNTGGPCPYLPGNGGLLYAAAMRAAGWDGCRASNAPGFPDDGCWMLNALAGRELAHKTQCM